MYRRRVRGGRRRTFPAVPRGIFRHKPGVTLQGFTVINAGFDAILVGLSSSVQVGNNVLGHNGNVGVDFNGSAYSQADWRLGLARAGWAGIPAGTTVPVRDAAPE
jgi:hypothetical protein